MIYFINIYYILEKTKEKKRVTNPRAVFNVKHNVNRFNCYEFNISNENKMYTFLLFDT